VSSGWSFRRSVVYFSLRVNALSDTEKNIAAVKRYSVEKSLKKIAISVMAEKREKTRHTIDKTVFAKG
jgi:hypothetical protein